MPTDMLKLISSVRKFPVLYRTKPFHDYHPHENIWKMIANECGVTDGHEANKLWKDLVQHYVEYLRDGKDFDYGKDLLFIQSHLIPIQSDSDELDEDELQRILDSDSDSETSTSNLLPPKTEAIASRSQKRKRLRSSKEMISIQTEKFKKDITVDSSTVDSSSLVTSNVSDMSSLQLIFLGYAKILQELPLSIQIRAKHKIAQIMNEAEMEMIRNEK